MAGGLDGVLGGGVGASGDTRPDFVGAMGVARQEAENRAAVAAAQKRADERRTRGAVLDAGAGRGGADGKDAESADFSSPGAPALERGDGSGEPLLPSAPGAGARDPAAGYLAPLDQARATAAARRRGASYVSGTSTVSARGLAGVGVPPVSARPNSAWFCLRAICASLLMGAIIGAIIIIARFGDRGTGSGVSPGPSFSPLPSRTGTASWSPQPAPLVAFAALNLIVSGQLGAQLFSNPSAVNAWSADVLDSTVLVNPDIGAASPVSRAMVSYVPRAVGRAVADGSSYLGIRGVDCTGGCNFSFMLNASALAALMERGFPLQAFLVGMPWQNYTVTTDVVNTRTMQKASASGVLAIAGAGASASSTPNTTSSASATPSGSPVPAAGVFLPEENVVASNGSALMPFGPTGGIVTPGRASDDFYDLIMALMLGSTRRAGSAYMLPAPTGRADMASLRGRASAGVLARLGASAPVVYFNGTDCTLGCVLSFANLTASAANDTMRNVALLVLIAPGQTLAMLGVVNATSLRTGEVGSAPWSLGAIAPSVSPAPAGAMVCNFVLQTIVQCMSLGSPATGGCTGGFSGVPTMITAQLAQGHASLEGVGCVPDGTSCVAGPYSDSASALQAYEAWAICPHDVDTRVVVAATSDTGEFSSTTTVPFAAMGVVSATPTAAAGWGL